MRRGTSSLSGTTALVLAVVGLFAVTPVAFAQQVTVPPGASEGDQYGEVVPKGNGNSTIDRGGGGGSAVAADQALRALGPEGNAAADLARATQPPKPGQSEKLASDDESSSDGMGTLLPILLGATLLAAVAYGLRRRLTPA